MAARGGGGGAVRRRRRRGAPLFVLAAAVALVAAAASASCAAAAEEPRADGTVTGREAGGGQDHRGEGAPAAPPRPPPDAPGERDASAGVAADSEKRREGTRVAEPPAAGATLDTPLEAFAAGVRARAAAGEASLARAARKGACIAAAAFATGLAAAPGVPTPPGAYMPLAMLGSSVRAAAEHFGARGAAGASPDGCSASSASDSKPAPSDAGGRGGAAAACPHPGGAGHGAFVASTLAGKATPEGCAQEYNTPKLARAESGDGGDGASGGLSMRRSWSYVTCLALASEYVNDSLLGCKEVEDDGLLGAQVLYALAMSLALAVLRRALGAFAGACVLPRKTNRLGTRTYVPAAAKRKWAKAAIEALYYSSNIALTLAMLSRDGLWGWCFDFVTVPWSEGRDSLFMYAPHEFATVEVPTGPGTGGQEASETMVVASAPPALVFIVLLEGAWYAAQIVHVAWTRVTRPGESKSDWKEMIVHHVVALGLVVAVCTTGHWRLAPPLWLAHNLSDPPLHVAKLLKYSAVEPLASTLFGVFVLVFFTSRLLYYPSLIANALRTYATEIGGAGVYMVHTQRTWLEIAGIGVMCALVPIHIFWFGLIVRMIARLLKGTMDADIRSDDDVESEEEEPQRRARRRTEEWVHELHPSEAPAARGAVRDARGRLKSKVSDRGPAMGAAAPESDGDVGEAHGGVSYEGAETRLRRRRGLPPRRPREANV